MKNKRDSIGSCCGRLLGVTLKKYLAADFMESTDYFSSKITYYIECPVCGKRTEEVDSSAEAIALWKKMNKKTKKTVA